MYRSLLISAIFLTCLSFSVHADNHQNSSAFITREELNKAIRKSEANVSPSPVDIVMTGLMVIGSGLSIPYVCIPDNNNPEMTYKKMVACAGSIIYFFGQTGDWINKIVIFGIRQKAIA